MYSIQTFAFPGVYLNIFKIVPFPLLHVHGINVESRKSFVQIAQQKIKGDK